MTEEELKIIDVYEGSDYTKIEIEILNPLTNEFVSAIRYDMRYLDTF